MQLMKLFKLLYSLLLFIPAIGFSQELCFFAVDTVGCAPFLVKINDCGNTTKPTVYIYEEPVGFTFDDFYTYTSPGIYDLSQIKGLGNPDTLIKVKYITVLDNPQPLITVSACANFIVHIDVIDTVYDKYIINYSKDFSNDTLLSKSSIEKTFSDNTTVDITVRGIYDEADCFNTYNTAITPIPILITPSIDSLITKSSSSVEAYFTQHQHHSYSIIESNSNINFQNNNNFVTINPSSKLVQYVFESQDACGNSEKSDTLFPVFLQGVANNNINDLEWKTLSSFNSDIIRNKNIIINLSGNSYQDNSILCGILYDYQIEQNQNGTTVKSNNVVLTAISTNTPPLLKDFHNSVENNTYTLKWDNNIVSILHLFDENNNFIKDLNTNDQQEVFTLFSTKSVQCIQVQYTDICNNVSNSLSPITCNTILSLNEGLDNNTLSWTAYKAYSNNISYELEWLDTKGNVLQTINLNQDLNYVTTLIFEKSQEYNFRIKININNEYIAYSNQVNIKQSPIMKIPNAFSPNQDGLNDTFKPLTLFIKEYRITILSLDNMVLYEGGEWDGNTQEQYFHYIIQYTDDLGKTHQFTGTGTIVR